MRCLALVLVLALAACDDPAPPPPATDDAFALLAPVDRNAVAEAFARLAETGYTADVTVTEYGPGGAVVGRFSALVTAHDGELQAEDRSGEGTLSDASDTPLRLFDPLDQALSDDPPYLDPSVRDAYQIRALGDTLVGGATLQRVEARLTDSSKELGVVRVWAAVDGSTGQVGAVEVVRQSESAVFDEDTTVRVDLTPTARGWRPRRVVTDTRTDVPLSDPRHVRVEWTIQDEP